MGRGHAGVAAAALMLDMAVAHMRTDKVVPFPADLQFCFLFIRILVGPPFEIVGTDDAAHSHTACHQGDTESDQKLCQSDLTNLFSRIIIVIFPGILIVCIFAIDYTVSM